jgi:hypothetical protein
VPILDSTARFKSLQNDYGPTRGVNSPASFTVHLWVGDPDLPDSYEMPEMTELEDGGIVPNGYAAPTILSDGFVVDDLGITQRAQFPDALEEWPDTATHWLLRDSVTGEGWDYSLLSTELDVTAAGPGPAIDVTVFYDDDVDPLA